MENLAATIATNVRNRRLELGLTMEQLAKKMGYKSKVSIFNIENGLANLPTAKIIELAAALDTTPALLLNINNSDQQTVQARFDKLDEERKKRLLAYLEFLEFSPQNNEQE